MCGWDQVVYGKCLYLPFTFAVNMKLLLKKGGGLNKKNLYYQKTKNRRKLLQSMKSIQWRGKITANITLKGE